MLYPLKEFSDHTKSPEKIFLFLGSLLYLVLKVLASSQEFLHLGAGQQVATLQLLRLSI
jgi:hypothetical protein